MPEIELAKYNIVAHPKTCFTMMIPQVMDSLKKENFKSVILCGIETQACITATTLGRK